MNKNLIPGMKVQIIRSKYTEETQGMGGRLMYEMVGKTHRLKNVFRDSVKIGAFYWDPRDVIPEKIEKTKPQIFHYDVSTMEGVK